MSVSHYQHNDNTTFQDDDSGLEDLRSKFVPFSSPCNVIWEESTTKTTSSDELSCSTTSRSSTTASRYTPDGEEGEEDYDYGESSYVERRNRRLQALKAARQARQEIPSTSVVPLGPNVCMEDHPYYLLQQKEKLAKVQGINSPISSTSSAHTTPPPRRLSSTSSRSLDSSSSSMDLAKMESDDALWGVDESMRDELVAAYELIHKQRVRIQHVEKQQDGIWTPLPRKESALAQALRELQRRHICLQHERAHGEFQFRNRITQDALRFRERLDFHKTRAEYWRTREQNAAEAHRAELDAAQRRIQELEQALQEVKLAATPPATEENSESSPSPTEAKVLVSPDKVSTPTNTSTPSSTTSKSTRFGRFSFFMTRVQGDDDDDDAHEKENRQQ